MKVILLLTMLVEISIALKCAEGATVDGVASEIVDLECPLHDSLTKCLKLAKLYLNSCDVILKFLAGYLGLFYLRVILPCEVGQKSVRLMTATSFNSAAISLINWKFLA